MAKTWQIVLATVAIFVAGLVTGGSTAIGVLRWVHHHRMMNAAQHPVNGQVQPVGPQALRNYALQLDLTRDQRARIGAIMRRTSFLMQEEIGDVLSVDQRARFEQMVREQRARYQEFRQGQQSSRVGPPN